MGKPPLCYHECLLYAGAWIWHVALFHVKLILYVNKYWFSLFLCWKSFSLGYMEYMNHCVHVHVGILSFCCV